jgi:hypothetical protein
MVLTTAHYLERYGHETRSENTCLQFLRRLFDGPWSVLFVGYGLEELEILEYVFSREAKRRSRDERRHTILQGFFSHDAILAESLTDYFADDLGVTLLAFNKDIRGWHQLVEVLEDLARDAVPGEALAAVKALEMERLLDD